MASPSPQKLLFLWILFGATSGCFDPKPTPGLACSPQQQCPSSQTCRNDICVPNSAIDRSPDANRADANTNVCPGTKIFGYSGEIETFRIPQCATTLHIEAYGAQGGSSISVAGLGGKGAKIKGTFAVQGGEDFKILVGAQGISGILVPGDASPTAPQGGGSGGGGSFVADSRDTPLLIAAGGGGAMDSLPGGPGQIIENAQDGSLMGNVAYGGNAGLGGNTSQMAGKYHAGTAGGGFFGGGNGDSASTAEYGTPNTPGASFVDGGKGGKGGSLGRDGGFGGGGAAGATGGGGGGYSGGGSGSFAGDAVRGGGGGGSLNTGTNQDNVPDLQSGPGSVVFSW